MTVKEIVNNEVKACEEAGVYSGFARFLMLELLNENNLDMYGMMDEKLDEEIHLKYKELMQRILQNEPLAYVLGYQWFYGYKIGVNKDVLIPREETEELVGHILQEIDDRYINPSIVDVATGSGAIALALAKELDTHVFATDISENALNVAKQNAQDLEADVTFYQGDMLEPLIEKELKFDVLICNPPYIKDTEHIQSSVLEYEPHVALFGGDDGLYFYRKVLEKAHLVLNPQGMLGFEIGFDIGEALTKLAKEYFPHKEITLVQDINELDRMLFIKPKTKLLHKEDKEEVVETLNKDGLVAIPTDTVYGLAIKSDNKDLYQKLKKVKGRPDDKPFPLMVSDIEQLESVVNLSDLQHHLVKAFMPGPITFIFNKKEAAFDYLEKQQTLGIRISNDPWVKEIIKALNQPIWLPSANLSGEKTATSSKEVLRQLDGAIDASVMGYSLNKSSSTVVDISDDEIKILREGPITKEALEKEVSKYLEKSHNFDKLKHKNRRHHMKDKAVLQAIKDEEKRQLEHIELIASENYVSEDVYEAVGSVLTNKYAEGYPGKRYYGGCEHVDVVENLAIDRLKEIFGAEHANVQPHSGSQANMAVYLSVLEHGDVVLGMDLSSGGHLTHGHQLNFSGINYTFFGYGVNSATEEIDYDEVLKVAQSVKPKLIVAGASAYARTIDFAKFREIADKVDALLMVDMAHIAGLVAAGLHPTPVPYADFVTSTTHKTLRGPRGGIILCKKEYAKDIDRSVFPGVQGGPLMHVIAGKAVSFNEALQPDFITYQKQVIKNIQTLSDTLKSLGYRIVSNGTDNHLLLVDIKGSIGLTGKHAELILDKVGITVNKNTIPFDQERPFVTSGIRLGSPAMTTRGFKEEDFVKIGHWIHEALTNYEDADKLEEIKESVRKHTVTFPIRGENI